MIYITVKQTPKTHQMTIDELLFGGDNIICHTRMNDSNTITYKRNKVDFESQLLKNKISTEKINQMLLLLKRFLMGTASLRAVENRHDLYNRFAIPKKSGGLRWIDAPNPELKRELDWLKYLLESEFNAKILHHTNAFAYIGQRSTLDAIKKHQSNQSRWFGKLDFSNFFGSITIDFTMKMLSMIFPFCILIQEPGGEEIVRDVLDLAFLDGVLPQGTPISPMLTNIIMIPIDFELTKKLNDCKESSFVYTRYADDFLISSRYDFDINNIVDMVEATIREFDAPLVLNKSKTRYASSAGRNWNLGLMLNKDNEITVGHKKKKVLKSMLHNYITDKSKGIDWELHDIQHMDGVLNYIKHIEPQNTVAIIEHINKTHNCNVIEMINKDLKV